MFLGRSVTQHQAGLRRHGARDRRGSAPRHRRRTTSRAKRHPRDAPRQAARDGRRADEVRDHRRAARSSDIMDGREPRPPEDWDDRDLPSRCAKPRERRDGEAPTAASGTAALTRRPSARPCRALRFGPCKPADARLSRRRARSRRAGRDGRAERHARLVLRRRPLRRRATRPSSAGAARWWRRARAIIDVGGESTRPGAAPVDVDGGAAPRRAGHRGAGRASLASSISVDTSKPEVMRAAVAAGAGLINDVRALQAPGALEAAAASGAAVCLMHMQGEPRTMQADPRYDDVVAEVRGLPRSARPRPATARASPRERICVDPGIRLRQDAGAQPRAARGARRGSPTRGLPGAGRPVAQVDARHASRARPSASGWRAASRWRRSAVLRWRAIVRAHDVAATVDAVRSRAAQAAIATGGDDDGPQISSAPTASAAGSASDPMTVDFALRLASAAARVLAPQRRHGADRQGHAPLRLHVRGRARGRLRRRRRRT